MQPSPANRARDSAVKSPLFPPRRYSAPPPSSWAVRWPPRLRHHSPPPALLSSSAGNTYMPHHFTVIATSTSATQKLKQHNSRYKHESRRSMTVTCTRFSCHDRLQLREELFTSCMACMTMCCTSSSMPMITWMYCCFSSQFTAQPNISCSRRLISTASFFSPAHATQ